MKRLLGALAVSVAVVSCGPMESPLRGTWFGGPIAMSNSVNQADSIFGNWNLTISTTGSITGTVMTVSPTRTIEMGNLTGTTNVVGATGPIEATIVFPTLGTYTMNGTLTFAATTNQVAFSALNLKNSAGMPIGTVTGVITRQ